LLSETYGTSGEIFFSILGLILVFEGDLNILFGDVSSLRVLDFQFHLFF